MARCVCRPSWSTTGCMHPKSVKCWPAGTGYAWPTDAGSVRDFQAFAKQTGNELIDQQTEGEDFIHVMRRR
jgi:hypothetical protein